VRGPAKITGATSDKVPSKWNKTKQPHEPNTVGHSYPCASLPSTTFTSIFIFLLPISLNLLDQRFYFLLVSSLLLKRKHNTKNVSLSLFEITLLEYVSPENEFWECLDKDWLFIRKRTFNLSLTEENSNENSLILKLVWTFEW